MSAPRLEAEFAAFATGDADVLAGALLVSRLLDPATDEAWCRQELARLAAAVRAPGDAQAVLETLAAAGFAGADEYYESRNSALSYVLKARRGIPISLAAVMIALCDTLGLPAHGINFPGHFLVRIDDQLVDPFLLDVVYDDDLDQRLEAAGVPAAQALRVAGPRDMVLRMLNNLRGLAMSHGNHALALEYTDYQLLLTEERYVLRMVRADLWRSLGVPGMVQVELRHALADAPDDATRDQIALRLEQPDPPRPRLH